MARDHATSEWRRQAVRFYVEGYDAYLRFVRRSPDWAAILRDEPVARRSPYGENDDFNQAWLEGWRDAVAETYAPSDIAQALAQATQVCRYGETPARAIAQT